MPLSILVPLVVVGLAIAIGAVHLSGGSRKRILGGANTVRDRFLIDFEGADVQSVFLSKDDQIALIGDKDKRIIGLVMEMGSKQITRDLTDQNGYCVAQSDSELVFTFPGIGLADVAFSPKNETELAEIQTYSPLNDKKTEAA